MQLFQVRQCPVEGVFEDVMSFTERAEVGFTGAPDRVPFGMVEVADQRGTIASLEPARAVAQLHVTA